MAIQKAYRPGQKRKSRGFLRTSGLLQGQIRKASESRGFSETRLLTHWAEFVGEDIARVARPVKVGYGRGGFGATLTILTTGAQAPMLQADLPRIKDKVNACYGYAAISKIHITQTAPTGFSEGQVQFAQDRHAPKAAPDPKLAAIAKDTAKNTAKPIGNDSLREALEALGQSILTQNKNS